MELLWRRENNEVWLTTNGRYQPEIYSPAAEIWEALPAPWLRRAELAALRQAADFPEPRFATFDTTQALRGATTTYQPDPLQTAISHRISLNQTALTAGPTFLSGMRAAPMLGDLATGADPDAVAGGDVVEELDEAGDAAGTASQPVAQCQ